MTPSSRQAELAANLAALEELISTACSQAGRDRSGVTVVAVTKTWPVSDAALLRDLGVTDLAENRDQDAKEKAAAIRGVRWHFVGSVQTNKARSIATYAHVVQSVDRPQVVAALSAGATKADRVLEVLLQVSLDGDPARGGALPAALPALADQVEDADGLVLKGVMAVAPVGQDPAAAFGRLQVLGSRLAAAHPSAVLISAGMSGDLAAAIQAGSTHVRVGTAVLGHRTAGLR